MPLTPGTKLGPYDPPSPQSNLYFYRISPDSRWVAYTSDESGQDEIYLTTFPEGKGKWRVSSSGGYYAAWSGNGKELIYTALTDDFFACPVTPKGAEIEVGTPQHLFHTLWPQSAYYSTFPPTASVCW